MTLPTRHLRDFLPLVLPHAPQCPGPVALQYLRLAAVEWCERTRCWREVVTTAIAQQNAAIVAPVYATIHEIEQAEFTSTTTGPIKLTPTQFSSLTMSELADTTAEAGAPRYITQSSPNTVAVYPYQAGSLEMSLFLKPVSGTEYGTNPADPLQDKFNVVPAHIFTQSAEKVAWGALGRLLNLAKSDWYDPQNAAIFFAKFNDACDDSFRSELRGQHRAPVRTRASFF